MTKAKKDATATPDGLAPDVEVPKLVPAILPGDLTSPCLVRFVGTGRRTSRQFGREQNLHEFELGSAFGRVRFSVWGTTQLDMKLRAVPRTSIVVIQYMGKPEGDRAQHQWTVRPFRGTSAQLQELQERLREGSEMVMQAIEAAENIMNLHSGQAAEDDDLPF